VKHGDDHVVPRRFIRSWDVFDTLIARRCVSREGVFDLMAEVLGSGFTAKRVQAELDARQHGREITIEDIYDQLQRVLEWTAAERQFALELELKTELDNVIPIADNLSRVKAGDIAISDMYLSPAIIGGLLRAAGLDKEIPVFVSNNGKGDGNMWLKLRREFCILGHTGDNAHSDFLRPWRHGVPARLTETSKETDWERLLRCNGAASLSAYVREMRLRVADADLGTRDLRRAQIEGNLPLLLFASAALIQWCNINGITRALMCSRDCVLWAPLAQKVAQHVGSPLEVEYFLISRVAAIKPSEKYLRYASQRLKPNTVVVDLSMTGTSLACLADRLGIERVRAFVIAWERSIAITLYGDKVRPKARIDAEYLTSEVIDDDLEAVNQAPTPSVQDVEENHSGLRVTYAAENRTESVLAAVRVQQAEFLDLVKNLPKHVIDEAIALAKSPRLIFLVRESARRAGKIETIISRARPGAALWNDPNAVTLGLPYANRRRMVRWLVGTVRRILRPLMPPGSFLHGLDRSSGLILGALRKRRRT
jgi:hypothetical protein